MAALSLVIPVRDEAENIGPLLAEIAGALEGVDHEVVCVDDASTDETPARLREAGGNVRVLRHDRACGKSTAVYTGVRAARATVVVMLDGDGQDDPRDIPRLLEALGDATDLLVNGERARRQDNWLRRLSSRVGNGVRRALLKDDTRDSASGFKAFARATFLELPYFEGMHRFLPALFLVFGNRVVHVPVNHRPRRHGQPKYGLRNRLGVGIIDLLGVRWLRRRHRRPQVEEVK